MVIIKPNFLKRRPASHLISQKDQVIPIPRALFRDWKHRVLILLKISLLFPKIPGYSKIEFSECWKRWMTACSDQAGHCVSSRILHVSIINALPKAASMFAIRQGLRARLNSAEITVQKTFMRSSARTWIPHCISVLVAMELIVSVCVMSMGAIVFKAKRILSIGRWYSFDLACGSLVFISK